MTEKFERIIKFNPAFDGRNRDPYLNYGIGSVRMIWILKGQLGAIQFVVLTGWHLPHVVREFHNKNDFHLDVHSIDLGCHSKFPLYEEHTVMDENCPYTNGICYYDGSTLDAIPVFDVLISEGDEAVWLLLGEKYEECFNQFRNENFVEKVRPVGMKTYRYLNIDKDS